jgi:c-di-GMP-binding flagellar brake protein YcgR
MQPMAMALSRRCVYAKLHVIWPKSMLYIFPLGSHTGRMRIRARAKRTKVQQKSKGVNPVYIYTCISSFECINICKMHKSFMLV